MREGMDVVAERVTFPSEGETLVGTLYRPATATGPLPALLVSGAWTTVKEQMPSLYARKLAAHGFIALAWDYRGWGESSGEPRAFESPRMKIRDIHAAAAFLRTAEGVDPERLGAVGVCASAGYMAHAIAQGLPVRSLALIASWLHDPPSAAAFYGGEVGTTKRLAAAAAAEQRFRQTGQVDYVPAYDPSNPDAAMFFELDYYANERRGRIPEWNNRYAVMGWKEWLEFDALSVAPNVRVPTLMVHSDGAALPDNARRFFASLGGPKELYWTEGDHIDFYDEPAHVNRAVRLAAEHLRETLASQAIAAAP